MRSTDRPGSLPVFFFLMVTVFPFLSYYRPMLALLIDLHKQLPFAAGKDPARSFSDIAGIHDSTFRVMGWFVTYLVNARNPRYR